MIIDLGATDHIRLPRYDLCIVGSGPAGATLANELKDHGLRTCLLESGKLKPTKHADALRKVHSEGICIKDHSRERVLGGTSRTWGGLSSPLDSVDMKPRSFVRYSGWPISREELMAYYDRASVRYGFPSLQLLDSHLEAAKRKGDILPRWKELEEKVYLAASDPLNFGKQVQPIFESSAIDLYLDATLIRLESGGQKRRVAWGIVRNSKGCSYRLEASIFVLATGGIENARILLNSRDMCPRGLGNEKDQVGRYLMNHPKNCYGVIRLSHPVTELPYYFGCQYQGYAGYAGLKLKESIQEEKGYLNCYVRLEPLFPWSANRGVAALVSLAKRKRSVIRLGKAFTSNRMIPLRDYSETGDDSEFVNPPRSALDWAKLFSAILINIPQVVRYLVYRFRDGPSPKITAIRLRNFMEMAPDPDNRVMLSDEKDVYGQPIPDVRHRPTKFDRRSLIALHRTLARELARTGIGELTKRLHDTDAWPIDQDASHHLGSTRMGEDPRCSVVNPDCRLHTVDNVYLAGGSVFPTSGCANPTFTIVALAIRLAQHLEESVFARQYASQRGE